MDAKAVREAIGAVAKRLIDVRLGTVSSDSNDPTKARVLLDGDSSGQPVAAIGLDSPLPSGTRVACLAYGSGGLLVLGPMSEFPGMSRFVYKTGSTLLTKAQVAGFTTLLIRGTGGGGAGGGAAATGAGQISFGSGGQGGSYGEIKLRIQDLVFPLQFNVGSAGVAVNGAAGGAGGTSSVIGSSGTGITYFSINGGAGGLSVTPAAGPGGVAGGNAALSGTADFRLPGQPGGYATTINAEPYGGNGGSSHTGAGGQGFLNANLQGMAGFQYGGGGAGSSRRASQAALPGGAGAIGLIVADLYR